MSCHISSCENIHYKLMLHTTHLFNNKSVNNDKEKKREAHLLSKTQQNSFDSAHTGFIASVDNMCTMFMAFGKQAPHRYCSHNQKQKSKKRGKQQQQTMSTISVGNRAKSSKAYGSGITTHQALFLTPCRQLGSTQSRPKVPEQQHSYYFNPLQPGKQQKALKF